MISLWGVIKGLLVQEEADRTKQVSLEIDSGATTNTKTTISAAQTADRTITLPDATDTLVGRDTTDTLTNKTIDGDDNTIQDVALSSLKNDVTGADEFIVRNGLGEVVDDKAVPSGDVVGTTDVQTLSNKSIDADANTITNIEDADIKAGAAIDATKIADGSVDNTEFQRLNGLTGDIQSQLDAKIDDYGAGDDNAVVKSNAAGDAIERSGVIIDDSDNITGVNDLTVDGDLTVNGTTTTVNTATLDVADTNITVNNGGNDASSEGAGLTVERTSTDGSFVYEDALASKFKIGALGSEAEVADVSSTQSLSNKSLDNTNDITVQDNNLTIQDDGDNTKQMQVDLSGLTTSTTRTLTVPDADTTIVGTDVQQQLTNKDIDGGTASDNNRITLPSNTRTNLDGLTRKAGTVAYDSSNEIIVYDNGTDLLEVGTGSESGTFNYIENGNFNRNINGVNTYDDGAVSEPVDGESVGAAPDLTVLNIQNNNFYGDGYLRVAKGTGVDGQGQGVAIDFKQGIGIPDDGGLLEVSFDYQTNGQYETGDVRVFVYNITQATMEGAVINDDGGAIVKSDSGKFLGYFFPSNILDDYRLILHYTGDNANTASYNLEIDNVLVTPSVSIPRTIPRHTKPIDVTVTTTGGGTFAFTQGTCVVWREGNRLFYRGAIFATSAGSGSTVFEINEPPEVVAEFGSLTRIVDTHLGSVQTFDLNSGAFFRDTTAGGTSNGFNIRAPESGGGVLQGLSLKATTQIYWEVSWRIQEWEQQEDALISTTENLFKNVYVRGNNNGGTSLTAFVTPIDFTEVEDDSNVWNGTQFTAPSPGRYVVSGQTVLVAASTAIIGAYVNGGFREWIGSHDSSTNTSVFSHVVNLNKGDTYELRANQNVTLSSSNVHNINITGVPDTSVFGLFGENQFEAATSAVKTPVTSGDWMQLTGNQIQLEPGSWILKGTGSFTGTSSPSYSTCQIGWFSSNGADSSARPSELSATSGLAIQAGGGLQGDGFSTNQDRYDNLVSASSLNQSVLGLNAPEIRVLVTKTATVYLNARSTMTTPSNARAWVNIYAEKLA